MPEDIGPAVASERLKSLLRQLRESAAKSAAEVDEALAWRPGSVGAMEAGDKSVQPLEALALAEVYGDSDRGIELVGLIALARSGLWWDLHGITAAHQRFVLLESEAERICVYQPLMVPGLLQTVSYATAVTAAVLDKDPDHPDVLARVSLRQERQRTFEGRVHSRRPAQLVVVLEEVVLSRPIGGTQVQIEQLNRLLDLAAEPHITLVVMPTALEGHVGMGGVFELLEFDNPDLDRVFIESAVSDQMLRGASLISTYRRVAQRLPQLGLTEGEALAAIRFVRDALSR